MPSRKSLVKVISTLLLIVLAIYVIGSDAFAMWWAKLSVSHNLNLGLDVLTPLTIIGSIVAFSVQALRHKREEEKNLEEQERFRRQVEKLKRTRQTVLDNLLDITGTLGQKQAELESNWYLYSEYLDLLHKRLKIPSGTPPFKVYDRNLDTKTDDLIKSMKAFYSAFKAKHFAIYPTLSAIEELELQDRRLKIDEIEKKISEDALDQKMQISRIVQGQDPENQTTRAIILKAMGNLEVCIDYCTSYSTFLRKKRNLERYVAESWKDTKQNLLNKAGSEPKPNFKQVLGDKLAADDYFTLLVMDLFTLENPYLNNWVDLLLAHLKTETEQQKTETEQAIRRSIDIAKDILLHGNQDSESTEAWNMVSKNLVNIYVDTEIERTNDAYAIQRYLALQTTEPMAQAINASTRLMINLSALCSITMNEIHDSDFKDVVQEFEDPEGLGYSLIEQVQVYEFFSNFNEAGYRPKTVHL